MGWQRCRFHEQAMVVVVPTPAFAGPPTATMPSVQPPTTSDDWLAITESTFDVGAIYDWAVIDRCGAVVLFSGTVRDHAEGRDGVESLTYEAYEEQAIPRLQAIVDELRVRWPETGRVALLHRVGRLHLGESSVIAAVSAPHRPGAFEAARYAIDALKESAPIWKREEWAGGSDWGTGANEVRDPQSVVSGPANGSGG